MAYGMTKVAAPAAAAKTLQHEEGQSSSPSPSSFYSPRRLKLYTLAEVRHQKIITRIKSNNKTKTSILKSSLTSFAVSHPRLITIGIYAGVALAISAAMGFALYPEQQAFAKAFVFYPE